MGGVVDLGQLLKVEVGIDLRGREVFVTEQLLNRAEVSARFEQVARERMAQHVRMDVHGKSAAQRPPAKPRLHRARRDAPAGARDEECIPGGRRTGARFEPAAQRRPRARS